MNPVTAHPQQQGITYVEHWCFAMGVACRLLTSVVAFAAHAILPFIRIEPRLDLESTAAYLTERNQWIEAAKATVCSHSQSRAWRVRVRPNVLSRNRSRSVPVYM